MWAYLQTLEGGWLSAECIESGRITMTRFVSGEGRYYIRVFPHKPVTAIPAEVTAGTMTEAIMGIMVKRSMTGVTGRTDGFVLGKLWQRLRATDRQGGIRRRSAVYEVSMRILSLISTQHDQTQ